MCLSSAPVSDLDLPSPTPVEAEIRRLSLATSAYELHGLLCGWLAGGGASRSDWLPKVMADAEVPVPASGNVLDELRLATAAQLADRSFEFELLLPPSEASLGERSGALFDWCRGFLSAFGLAGGGIAPLSDEAREALADLAKLAAARPQEEGDEEEEQAMVEIEEFVRVAVLLIHGDCVLAPQHRQQFN